jgi:hypothetical protein
VFSGDSSPARVVSMVLVFSELAILTLSWFIRFSLVLFFQGSFYASSAFVSPVRLLLRAAPVFDVLSLLLGDWWFFTVCFGVVLFRKTLLLFRQTGFSFATRFALWVHMVSLILELFVPNALWRLSQSG